MGREGETERERESASESKLEKGQLLAQLLAACLVTAAFSACDVPVLAAWGIVQPGVASCSDVLCPVVAVSPGVVTPACGAWLEEHQAFHV